MYTKTVILTANVFKFQLTNNNNIININKVTKAISQVQTMLPQNILHSCLCEAVMFYSCVNWKWLPLG